MTSPFSRREAKESCFTHLALFQTYLVVDKPSVDALEARYKKTVNRTRTTKCETWMLKAISATTKTLETQQTSLKSTMQEHAKFTHNPPEDWFFAPLLLEANRVLDLKESKKPVQKPAKK